MKRCKHAMEERGVLLEYSSFDVAERAGIDHDTAIALINRLACSDKERGKHFQKVSFGQDGERYYQITKSGCDMFLKEYGAKLPRRWNIGDKV